MKEETTRIEYRGVPVDITITWNYFHSTSVDHIEIETLDDHPLPMTETGYYSHFCHFGENFTMAEAVEWFYQENKKTDRNTFQDDFFSSVPSDPVKAESIKHDATPQDIKTFNSEPLIKPGAKANQPSLF